MTEELETTGNSTQRRIPSDEIGFSRSPLLPKGASGYEAPEEYPELARKYLEELSRIGTMSGATTLAGIGNKRVYEWRLHLEGFKDEEQAAKDCMTDYLEENLFDAGINEVGMARVKALEVALRAKKREYNPKQNVEVEGEVGLNWLDILKQSHQEDDNE